MNNNIVDVTELKWLEGKVKGFFGKELISLNNGGLKLIKVAPFASYPEHIHPDKTEYAYVLEGEPEFCINSESHTGKAGHFCIFPFNTKHSITNRTESECILLIGSIQN